MSKYEYVIRGYSEDILVNSDNCYVTAKERIDQLEAENARLRESLSKPKPNLAVDAPILVRNRGNNGWLKRHFAGWDCDCVQTWQCGCTSFTTQTTVSWSEWKLPEGDK